jgi:hypothetical protein
LQKGHELGLRGRRGDEVQIERGPAVAVGVEGERANDGVRVSALVQQPGQAVEDPGEVQGPPPDGEDTTARNRRPPDAGSRRR